MPLSTSMDLALDPVLVVVGSLVPALVGSRILDLLESLLLLPLGGQLSLLLQLQKTTAPSLAAVPAKVQIATGLSRLWTHWAA